MKKLAYPGQLVHKYDRDRFFAALFVKPEKRDALLALLALNVELLHIHDHVREEVAGHMRYAWWQQALENLYAGTPALGHPVIEALEPVTKIISKEQLLELPAAYREAYPALPDVAVLMDRLSRAIIKATSPESEPRWEQAGEIIAVHRQKHPRGNVRLSWKLLWSNAA